MGVVCASKLKFGVVLPSCLCGGVTMSSLFVWPVCVAYFVWRILQ